MIIGQFPDTLITCDVLQHCSHQHSCFLHNILLIILEVVRGCEVSCSMMEDEQSGVVHESSRWLHDGSSRKRSRRTKIASLGDPIVMNEMLWSELHEDLLERVIARLPVSSIFRFRSVCKRWSSSFFDSPSFLKACLEGPSRSPWFYMVDSKADESIVYDPDVDKWHHIPHPQDLNNNCKSKPVASAGGLICFKSALGHLTVCNPLTGRCCKLPHLETTEAIHAIAMVTCEKSYKVVLMYGEMPAFRIKVYDSSKHCWSEQSINWSIENKSCGKSCSMQDISSEDGTVYFLNKGGNVVACDMRCSSSKEFSCILISSHSSEEIIYFLNRSGKVVACSIQKGLCYEFPTLLPSTFEYSLDLVNCGGRMLVVVLLELLESCTVRIWEFNEAKSEWVQVLAMPPAMSHHFYGKKADINCTGYDNLIMICVSSRRFYSLLLCNIAENSWHELPCCYIPGSRKVKKFVSSVSFEPRLDALV
eukprot:Gb_09933 [translate_table: standard]